jgi:hypothetical protein
MNNKIIVLFLIILVSPVIAGSYGIIHNQITYTISPEFFTKNMFYRFGLDEYFNGSQRLGASIVGFLSTWWLGIPIGIILAIVGCLFDNGKTMLKRTLMAMSIAILFAVITPFISVIFYFSEKYLNSVSYEQYFISEPEFLPEGVNIDDHFNFYLVGQIHNFSYLGGLLGLFAGIIYLIWKFKKEKPTTNRVDG